MSDDDEERLRNLQLFKVYATDEEMGFGFLVLLVIIGAAGIGYGIWQLIQWFFRPM